MLQILDQRESSYAGWLPLVSRRGLLCFPDGQRCQPGSESRPFATLEAARDAARKLRQAGQVASRRPHDLAAWWRLPSHATLELTAADSGTAESPVVWRSYQNESVRLLGGRRLTEFKPVTDPAVLERLDETARPMVREVDLRALGIAEFGELASRGFGRPTVPAHCELFIDGEPMTLARWPNEGQWEQIAGFPEANAQNDGHGGKIGKLEDGFQYARGSAATVEGHGRHLGARVLVVGLGQLVRTRRVARSGAAADQDRAAVRPVRVSDRATVLFSEHAGRTRPAGRMDAGSKGGQALLLAAAGHVR